jgi:hypothetical protein
VENLNFISELEEKINALYYLYATVTWVGANVQHTQICHRGCFGLSSILRDGNTLDPCYEIWDYFANSYRMATNCLSMPVVCLVVDM